MVALDKKKKIVQDILRAINNDEWMWIVCWGNPRTGKSSLCLRIAYEIYGDWDTVLNCIVFNLSQTIYKLKDENFVRWPTQNELHMRIPMLIWDDFGAYSNKAITQHDPAWDVFKGAFDTLGTKVAVIMPNMVSPFSPTQQLQIKFTHELWIEHRGKCKYDRVRAEQDFSGWNPRSKKEWIDTFEFPEVPDDVFRQYDEMRMSLADEVLQTVEDRIADVHLGSAIKRLQPMDIRLLRHIEVEGPHLSKTLAPELRQVVTRLKARQLITPVRIKAHYYKYDLTDLGCKVLDELTKRKRDAEKVPTPPTK